MERIDDPEKSTTGNKRLVIGTIIIFAGFLILGKQLHIIPHGIYHFIFSWQMLLVIIGAVVLSYGENKISGIVLILVGGFFLLADHVSVDPQLRRLFWPMILILIGILIIFRRPLHAASLRKDRTKKYPSEYIDDVNFFSGGKYNLQTDNFKGGRITAVFGGSEFDLTNCKLSGENNTLDVFTLFGGVKLFLPEDWNVQLDAVNIFGGFSDKRRNPAPPGNENKTLSIKGLVLFGGVEIK